MIKNLYAIVVKHENGGENMKSFHNKNEALKEGEKLINYIKNKNINNKIEIYLSKLNYDPYENVILSSHLINKKSKLLFKN